MSREGEDNEQYYDVKIKAAKLLLDNIDNTFVTPVFNGSTSLRDAAGQMIENVTKSVKRKEEINDGYMEELFSDMNALYRLDSQGQQTSVSGEKDLGPLPAGAAALIAALVIVWCLMLLYVVLTVIKRKKSTKF